jgi:hypothetical protein
MTQREVEIRLLQLEKLVATLIGPKEAAKLPKSVSKPEPKK